MSTPHRSHQSSEAWCSLATSLGVAWLAVAPLYMFGVADLPEPAVGLVVSTAVGLVMALAGLALDGPRRTPSAVIARVVGDSADLPQPGVPLAGAPASVDPSQYALADSSELQCAHCGGFDVDRRAASGPMATAICRTCGTGWPADPSVSPPDVVVRSWLHR